VRTDYYRGRDDWRLWFLSERYIADVLIYRKAFKSQYVCLVKGTSWEMVDDSCGKYASALDHGKLTSVLNGGDTEYRAGVGVHS
jgi:hypothetical protein